MVCVITVFTLPCASVCACARATMCLFFYTTAYTVYISMIVTVQKCVANKGWRCGRLFPPPSLSLRGSGEMERGNVGVWSDVTALHYLYLLICLALS